MQHATPNPPGDSVQEPPQHSFAERELEAVENGQQRASLLNFQRAWRVSRDGALVDGAFEERRERLVAAKQTVLSDLETYVQRFKAAASANGVHIHEAKDADEARRIVLGIARANNVKLLVKSKTMVSEEIELSPDLEEAGICVVETDLGEWLVQLAGERPSHMVMPAIHMDRRRTAQLLEKGSGQTLDPDDIKRQVSVARTTLREAFLTADMGISGANALVAETGTVMMVTNEGNGRLTTSLPRVHVVLAGWEKLVPTFEDAANQITLLPKSATAQRITSYVTWLTAPRAGQERHIVLVDNGRSAMKEAPEFKEALQCIRCAACANVCPPFREVGGHVFGYIYTGAIGLVNTPFHHGLNAATGPQSLCVGCNACETVCPAGIPLPRQILDVRARVVEAKGLPTVKKLVFAVLSDPAWFDRLARIASVFQMPFVRGGFVSPPGMARQSAWRKMPALARRPFRDLFFGRTNAATDVELFPGCMIDRLYPEIGLAAVRVLEGCGKHVGFSRTQNCCGLPALNSGALPLARKMARQTIEALESTPAANIVSPSASCAACIKQDYLHLFRDDPEWLPRAEVVSRRVHDLTSFLDQQTTQPLARAGGSITYHDACQSCNALGLKEEPRRLLKAAGIEITEMPESTVCCGFGGSFSFEHPEVAAGILGRKLDNVATTGERIIVTDNPGCMMHLRGGAAAQGLNYQVKHLAEILDAGT